MPTQDSGSAWTQTGVLPLSGENVSVPYHGSSFQKTDNQWKHFRKLEAGQCGYSHVDNGRGPWPSVAELQRVERWPHESSCLAGLQRVCHTCLCPVPSVLRKATWEIWIEKSIRLKRGYSGAVSHRTISLKASVPVTTPPLTWYSCSVSGVARPP